MKCCVCKTAFNETSPRITIYLEWGSEEPDITEPTYEYTGEAPQGYTCAPGKYTDTTTYSVDEVEATDLCICPSCLKKMKPAEWVIEHLEGLQ